MDAMPYEKTAKSERFSVENLEAGCIILARHNNAENAGFHDTCIAVGRFKRR